ncbi:MAG: IS3 family transposase [Bacteroidales bacterium]|nr:IS3 family transposase [Candidatus Cryptobacteroides caccocaballi]
MHAESATECQVAELCGLFGVSKQAYYQYDEDAAHAKAAREEFALQYIRDIRKEDPGIGGMKLWYMYQRDFRFDNPIGRDRFCRIMDENNLKVRLRIRKPRTTDSTHGLPTYPNLIKEYIPTAANQLWVSDITYIVIMDDDFHYLFCYLSMILDAYTEEIVGWSVGPTLDTEYPIEALRMALKRIEGKDVNLVHHSDRGCQYASREYVNTLRQHGIRVSMTESGDPKDNAQAERINNTMKNELLKDKVFRSIGEVIAAVALAVDFYNNRRPHMSIGMMTPSEAAESTGDRDMRWTSYRHMAIKSRDNLYITENSLPLPACQGSPSGLRSPVNP